MAQDQRLIMNPRYDVFDNAEIIKLIKRLIYIVINKSQNIDIQQQINDAINDPTKNADLASICKEFIDGSNSISLDTSTSAFNQLLKFIPEFLKNDINARLFYDVSVDNLVRLFRKSSGVKSDFDSLFELVVPSLGLNIEGSRVSIVNFNLKNAEAALKKTFDVAESSDSEDDEGEQVESIAQHKEETLTEADLQLALQALGIDHLVKVLNLQDLHTEATKSIIKNEKILHAIVNPGMDDWYFATASFEIGVMDLYTLDLFETKKTENAEEQAKIRVEAANLAYETALKKAIEFDAAEKTKNETALPIKAARPTKLITKAISSPLHENKSDYGFYAIFIAAKKLKQQVKNADELLSCNKEDSNAIRKAVLNLMAKQKVENSKEKSSVERSSSSESDNSEKQIKREYAKTHNLFSAYIKSIKSKHTSAKEKMEDIQAYKQLVNEVKKSGNENRKQAAVNAHLLQYTGVSKKPEKTLVRGRKKQAISAIINNNFGETQQVVEIKTLLNTHILREMKEALQNYKKSWTQRRTAQVDALLANLEKLNERNISVNDLMKYITEARNAAIREDANINANRLFLPRRDILKSRFIQMLDTFHLNLVSQLTIAQAEQSAFVKLQWDRLANLIDIMRIRVSGDDAEILSNYRDFLNSPENSDSAKYKVAKDLVPDLQRVRVSYRKINPDLEKMIRLCFFEVENLNQYFNQTQSLRKVNNNEETVLHQIGDDVMKKLLTGTLIGKADNINIPVSDELKQSISRLKSSQRELVTKITKKANLMVQSLIDELKPKYEAAEFATADFALDAKGKTLTFTLALKVNEDNRINYKFLYDINTNSYQINWPQVENTQLINRPSM